MIKIIAEVLLAISCSLSIVLGAHVYEKKQLDHRIHLVAYASIMICTFVAALLVL